MPEISGALEQRKLFVTLSNVIRDKVISNTFLIESQKRLLTRVGQKWNTLLVVVSVRLVGI